jgi:hypothetical protein
MKIIKKENHRIVLSRYSAQGYTAAAQPPGQNGPAGVRHRAHAWRGHRVWGTKVVQPAPAAR